MHAPRHIQSPVSVVHDFVTSRFACVSVKLKAGPAGTFRNSLLVGSVSAQVIDALAGFTGARVQNNGKN